MVILKTEQVSKRAGRLNRNIRVQTRLRAKNVWTFFFEFVKRENNVLQKSI